MRQKHRFRPIVSDRLEVRVVPATLYGVGPAAVAPLDLSGRVRGLNVAAVDQISQAFDRFTQDFLQTQGAYFASSPTSTTTPGTDPNTARLYFRSFVVQRVELLAQELTNLFVQLPGGIRRGGPNGSTVVQSFLRQRITGPGQDSLSLQLAGRGPRNTPIPLISEVSGAGATLYTTSALTTINTARAATLNASGYLLKSTFAKGKH